MIDTQKASDTEAVHRSSEIIPIGRSRRDNKAITRLTKKAVTATSPARRLSGSPCTAED
jgi:hypothetical protein